MGFVFQSYALFPTKTVADNIGFSDAIKSTPRLEMRARIRELATLVELDHLLDRYPHELSGGQQQRVALARALASRPEVLLLDEPMSALDARIRAKLRTDLRILVNRLGLTTLYVTHDQEEAFALSDRIAVMANGRIEQVGTPSGHLSPARDALRRRVRRRLQRHRRGRRQVGHRIRWRSLAGNPALDDDAEQPGDGHLPARTSFDRRARSARLCRPDRDDDLLRCASAAAGEAGIGPHGRCRPAFG